MHKIRVMVSWGEDVRKQGGGAQGFEGPVGREMLHYCCFKLFMYNAECMMNFIVKTLKMKELYKQVYTHECTNLSNLEKSGKRVISRKMIPKEGASLKRSVTIIETGYIFSSLCKLYFQFKKEHNGFMDDFYQLIIRLFHFHKEFSRQ